MVLFPSGSCSTLVHFHEINPCNTVNYIFTLHAATNTRSKRRVYFIVQPVGTEEKTEWYHEQFYAEECINIVVDTHDRFPAEHMTWK